MSLDLETVRDLLDTLDIEQRRWLPGAACSDAAYYVDQARRRLAFLERTEEPSLLDRSAHMRWRQDKRNAEDWLAVYVGTIESRVLGMPKEYYLGISPDQNGEE